MRTMKRLNSIVLGVLLCGFIGAMLMGACGGDEPNSISSTPTPDVCPLAGACEPTECPAEVEMPCKRFRIPLVGDPTNNPMVRAKYIAAFGTTPCYTSAANTFDCFYRAIKPACTDAALIGEVSGNAPYDKGYTCQPVGNGDFTLQIGPDVANNLTVEFKDAPRQSPDIEVNGVPTPIIGPYRNLTEPQDLKPGNDFYKTTLDKNGNLVEQRELILQTNRNANSGEIHSDLAGFVYPCDKSDPSKMCIEPLILIEGSPNDADAVQVHHVVRKSDLRCCAWGTNSNANAVVISRRLNQYFYYKYPSGAEVTWVNNIPPYTP